ncbi:MAG: cell surface protein [Caulobacteraceae bacterium]|nr:cell surface protein [Caulobacter sp.]RYF90899.1 MAG: cell surface protein [Caulobacteraceae bacterium]
MRILALAAVAALGLTLAACDSQDRADLKEGANAAGAEVKEAAHDIANDPDVKEAGAAIKEVGAEAADAVKDTAANAQADLAESSREDKAEAANDKAAGKE